ncbi:Fic family protein [Nesterenkonia sp. Act20]|uniref:Fic family protein n=1 Tax=Nesterenkonia sp. Act20 TaxID=1483432 RepID=UPI001C45BA60|nr:Fic family protein [Nesterenkonia sp. Act20]
MTSTTKWPPLSYEDRQWVPSAHAAWGARAEQDLAGTRYQSALAPEIAGLTPEPSTPAREAAAEAERELTRFDSELGSRVAAFAPVLLRSEAASSSQIENLTASARAIFSVEVGAKGNRNAESIAANTGAMNAALDVARDLSAGSIRILHSVLLAGQPRHTPGHWRDQPVWIGTRADSPVGASFVAPHQSHVPGLMDDLVAFVSDLSVAPLISVAVGHAQFETIHPFTDGNGRTGRALSQAMLRHRGVTRNVAVPVSAGLLADVEGYHAALTAYRAGDVDPIIEAFAAASLRAVHNARQLVADIDEIRQSWNHRLKARTDSNAWKILDLLARRPVLNTAVAAEELGIARPNVHPPLKAIVAAGIAKQQHEHQRGMFWRSDEILAAIDAFAVRAGRRSAQ